MENREERQSFYRMTFSLFVCIFVGVLNLSAQKNVSQDKDKVYHQVTDMPYYLYGGSDENYGKDVHAIYEYLFDNIRYPEDAWTERKQGTVICNFIVEKDGSFSNISVIQSIHPSLDKEAIRVISSFPKWHPGTVGGKAVRTNYNLPIIFRMRGAKRNE